MAIFTAVEQGAEPYLHSVSTQQPIQDDDQEFFIEPQQ